MDEVKIQYQDNTGWVTVLTLYGTAQGAVLLNSMQDVKHMYPKYRIRAVDENDRLLDIFG